MPNATSASTPRSALRDVEPDRRHEPREREREADREPGAHERRDAGADRPRLARARDDEKEHGGKRDRADAERVAAATSSPVVASCSATPRGRAPAP